MCLAILYCAYLDTFIMDKLKLWNALLSVASGLYGTWCSAHPTKTGKYLKTVPFLPLKCRITWSVKSSSQEVHPWLFRTLAAIFKINPAGFFFATTGRINENYKRGTLSKSAHFQHSITLWPLTLLFRLGWLWIVVYSRFGHCPIFLDRKRGMVQRTV